MSESQSISTAPRVPLNDFDRNIINTQADHSYQQKVRAADIGVLAVVLVLCAVGGGLYFYIYLAPEILVTDQRIQQTANDARLSQLRDLRAKEFSNLATQIEKPELQHTWIMAPSVPPEFLKNDRLFALSPKGDFIASASDVSIRIWTTDGKQVGQAITIDSGSLSSPRIIHMLAISPRGDLIAAAGEFGIRLWKRDGTPHGNIPHVGNADSVAFSLNGDIVASGASDGSVHLWTIDGKARGQPLRGVGNKGVFAIAFSPNGGLIAAGDADGNVRVWAIDGTTRGSFRVLDQLRSLAFAPDGELLATGAPGSVTLWNVDGRRQQHVLDETTGATNAIAFSPKGDLLAKATLDGEFRLFSLDRKQFVGAPATGRGFDFAFARDARELYVLTTSGGMKYIPFGAKQHDWLAGIKRGDEQIAGLILGTLSLPIIGRQEAFSISSEVRRINENIQSYTRELDSLRTRGPSAPAEKRDWWQEQITLMSTRVGAILIVLFLVQIFLGIYRYSVKLAAFHAAREQALRLLLTSVDPDVLEKLAKTLTPEEVDFSKNAISPAEQMLKLVEQLRK